MSLRQSMSQMWGVCRLTVPSYHIADQVRPLSSLPGPACPALIRHSGVGASKEEEEEEEEAVSQGCPASTAMEGLGSVGLSQALPAVEEAFPASQS